MKKLIFFLAILLISCPDMLAQGGINTLWFDGSDDYVDCGTDTSLDLAEQLTIEVWIKGNNNNYSWARIVDKYQFFVHQGFSFVREPNTNSVMLDFWATDGSKHSCGALIPVFDEQWHYVATTFDGNVVKMYVDGNFQNQLITDDKIIQFCPDHLLIAGGWDGATWFPYLGYIDEVRVWNTAVDSITIKEWTHKKITPEHPHWSNMVGYWKFNEGSGSSAGDSSNVGNHGVLTNIDTTSAWFTSTAPLATILTDTLLNISATWVSVDSNYSSILSVEDDNISGDDCVIFGHTDAELSWINTDVPVNHYVINRLDRVWRMEVYGMLSGNIIFNVSTLGITYGDSLKLLVDSDNVFADADTVHGTYDPENLIFSVSGQDFKHGFYYTLGTSENLVSIEEWNDRNNQEKIMLHQIYPNPFSTSTTIQYELQQPEKAILTIYNHLGQLIYQAQENQPKGTQQLKWNAEGYADGVYYYRLNVGDAVANGKMVKVR